MERQGKQKPEQQERNESVQHPEEKQSKVCKVHAFHRDVVASALGFEAFVVDLLAESILRRHTILENDLFVCGFVDVHSGPAKLDGARRLTKGEMIDEVRSGQVGLIVVQDSPGVSWSIHGIQILFWSRRSLR